jgi:hypothetical protein
MLYLSGSKKIYSQCDHKVLSVGKLKTHVEYFLNILSFVGIL